MTQALLARSRGLLTAAVLCLWLSACAGFHFPWFGHRAPAEPDATTPWQVRMHRGICFGQCPSYRVEISSTGTVHFAGERFVPDPGPHDAQAKPDTLARLRRAVLNPELAGLANDYLPQQKNCGVWATDFPTLTIDLTIKGQSREIRHYLGCEQAPQALRDLETLIDAAADVGRWTQAPIKK